MFTQLIQNGGFRAPKVSSASSWGNAYTSCFLDVFEVCNWGRLGFLMCASNFINGAVVEFEIPFHLRMPASSIQHDNPFTQHIILPIFGDK